MYMKSIYGYDLMPVVDLLQILTEIMVNRNAFILFVLPTPIACRVQAIK